jgi:hypothetical protein
LCSHNLTAAPDLNFRDIATCFLIVAYCSRHSALMTAQLEEADERAPKPPSEQPTADTKAAEKRLFRNLWEKAYGNTYELLRSKEKKGDLLPSQTLAAMRKCLARAMCCELCSGLQGEEKKDALARFVDPPRVERIAAIREFLVQHAVKAKSAKDIEVFARAQKAGLQDGAVEMQDIDENNNGAQEEEDEGGLKPMDDDDELAVVYDQPDDKGKEELDDMDLLGETVCDVSRLGEASRGDTK